jgi:hypothetical protein
MFDCLCCYPSAREASRIMYFNRISINKRKPDEVRALGEKSTKWGKTRKKPSVQGKVFFSVSVR